MKETDILFESFKVFQLTPDESHEATGGGSSGFTETMSNWWSGKSSECVEVCYGETFSMTDYSNGNVYSTNDCLY